MKSPKEFVLIILPSSDPMSDGNHLRVVVFVFAPSFSKFKTIMARKAWHQVSQFMEVGGGSRVTLQTRKQRGKQKPRNGYTLQRPYPSEVLLLARPLLHNDSHSSSLGKLARVQTFKTQACVWATV